MLIRNRFVKDQAVFRMARPEKWDRFPRVLLRGAGRGLGAFGVLGAQPRVNGAQSGYFTAVVSRRREGDRSELRCGPPSHRRLQPVLTPQRRGEILLNQLVVE